jgi:hypothetical protein
MNIICHIIGLNYYGKKDFISFIDNINKKYNKNIIIKDLDALQQELLRDAQLKTLNLNYEREINAEKKRVIMKKLCEKWKEQFESNLSQFEKKNNDANVIYLGLNNYYKKLNVGIKLNSDNNFFVDSNPIENAKEIVKYNITTHFALIIEGKFPVKYLDYDFLIAERLRVKNKYMQTNYNMKKITFINSWIENYAKKLNKNISQKIIKNNNIFYYATNTLYDDTINLNKKNIPKSRIDKIINVLSKIKTHDSNANDTFNFEGRVFPTKTVALLGFIRQKHGTDVGFTIDKDYNTGKIELVENSKNGFNKLLDNTYLYTINKSDVATTDNVVKIKKGNIKYIFREHITNIFNELKNCSVKFHYFK